MAERETVENVSAASGSGDEDVVAEPEPKIMCYVSKEMVLLKDTIEVEYSAGKSFRVLPKYVKYQTEGDNA